MACKGGFNFGHASKWDRQQLQKKAEKAEATIKVSEVADAVDSLKEVARDFERKMAEAVMNFEEDSKKAKEALASDEWIWVEGYKGTDKDMQCRGYQFELNKQFDMPEGADIKDCESGFHFCRDLKDVFGYYRLGGGNRFFKVHALVRKKDYEEYGKYVKTEVSNALYYMYGSMYGQQKPTTLIDQIRDKLTSKSIVFLHELTPDVVCAAYAKDDISGFTLDEKALAMKESIDHVRNIHKSRELVTLGYSEAFAKYIVEAGHYKAAYAAGMQEGLSMDMKVAFILREDC